MNCDDAERQNVAARYLSGKLAPDVAEQWEQHYFGCDRCFEQLEVSRAALEPLREMEASIRQEIPARKIAARWLWAGAAIAAAALFLISTVTVHRPLQPNPAITSQLAELARFDPPAFSTPSMRGGESKAEAQFLRAMAFYQQRDYPRAMEGLRAALDLDPAAAPPRFFLGACLLLTGKPEEASGELRAVAAADSPFAEEARFGLAKAYLREGRKGNAAIELRHVAMLNGDFAAEANRLLVRLQEIQ